MNKVVNVTVVEEEVIVAVVAVEVVDVVLMVSYGMYHDYERIVQQKKNYIFAEIMNLFAIAALMTYADT